MNLKMNSKIIIVVLAIWALVATFLVWKGITLQHIQVPISTDKSVCSAVDIDWNGTPYLAPEGYGFYVCPEQTIAPTQSI